MPSVSRSGLRPVVLLLMLAVAAPSLAAPPQWLWTSQQAQTNETALFRKKFTVKPGLKSAVLAVAADNLCAVRIDNEMVTQATSWSQPVHEDVTKKLTPGEHGLNLFVTNQDGPAGLAVRLVLKYDDASREEIVSDLSWQATGDPQRAWKGDESAWAKPVSLGKLGVAPWGKVVLGETAVVAAATPLDAITVPAGFTVDLIHTVSKETEGSWVSLTTDNKGRLIACDQYGGLFRIVPGKPGHEDETTIESLDIPIGDSQGLLYAYDSLYLTVNGGGNGRPNSGFYRVRDTDGDDKFDKIEKLQDLKGAGEHGPHAVRLGPDGRLWIIAGNHTDPPADASPDSPLRNYAEDLLLKRNPDGNGHATGRMAPAGWIASCDKDGNDWQLFCGGFRNPYDFAFNTDGEIFVYDADMEWDTGTPWYRPTRVNHAVSAGEFGWRYGTGKWPAYYPDSLGAVVDIGLGSPTGVEFGTALKAPAKWQQALFIADWTYGKIYAVHPKAMGAGYTASFETFAEGRPLPVTDLAVNPQDGALYVTTGGRKMQSGLYRIRYTGTESTAAVERTPDTAAAKARTTRKMLETYHTKIDPAAVNVAWPYLNSPDRNLRYAARVAIERQPLESWLKLALAETHVTAQIQAMVALARVGSQTNQAAQEAMQPLILARLLELPLSRMTEEQIVEASRAYGLAFIRLGGKPDAAKTDRIIAQIDPLVPAGSEPVNQELTKLLVYLEAPSIAAKSMARLTEARTQQDQMFYVFTIRTVEQGWTPALREMYFNWINLAEKKGAGGNSFRKFLTQIRDDSRATMTDAQAAALGDVLTGTLTAEPVSLETTRQFVHNWQLADFLSDLPAVEHDRNFESGKQAYLAAQCAKCHRFAGEGGDTGPDITGVGARFSPEYILESLIEPSKAVSDQYKNVTIVTVKGEIVTGRVINETAEALFVRTDPFARVLTEIKKADVDEQVLNPVSEMPQGLINSLTKDEVLDLIAYLRSAGSANDRAFEAAK